MLVVLLSILLVSTTVAISENERIVSEDDSANHNKDYNTISNGIVQENVMTISEISNNVALLKPSYASSSYLQYLPGKAFDGNKTYGNMWNSGRWPPSWIYVDLKNNYNISRILLTVRQTPNGTTTHKIYTSNDATNWILARTLSGYTYMNQVLAVDFSPPVSNVRYVKVETVSSPSWVSWVEIEVYAPTMF